MSRSRVIGQCAVEDDRIGRDRNDTIEGERGKLMEMVS